MSAAPYRSAPAPCPPPTAKTAGATRAPIRPMIPAISTMAGKGTLQEEYGDERRRGNCPQRRVLERPRADAVRSEHHDRGDRRLDAVEEACHRRHFTECEIDPGERDQDEERRQHEQPARHHAAKGAVHEPPDVGRELLRLGAGEHHAVVERVQKAPLGYPAPSLDELLVHHRDLSRRPAEADETELQPVASRRSQRRWRRRRGLAGFLRRCMPNARSQVTVDPGPRGERAAARTLALRAARTAKPRRRAHHRGARGCLAGSLPQACRAPALLP